MKPLIQSEAAECGLACLAMVAGHYGLHMDLPQMRRRFPLSLKGLRLNQLIEHAQQLGLNARALRLEMQDLGRLKLPCILHWDLNHFVVLARVGRKKAVLLDPASGRREMDLQEVSRHFTGVALELAPAPQFRPQRAAPAVSLRQLTGPVRGLWGALAQVLLLSAALQVFVVLAPFYMQWVVDHVLVSADRDLLAVLGLGFGLALLVQLGIGFLRGWTVVHLSSSLGLQWAGRVFAHLLRLPMAFFEKRHVGDVTSRMGAVQAIQKTLSMSFVEALIDGLMAAVTLALMLVYSWKLALVTLLAVALYAGLRLAAFAPLRDGTEQQLLAAARQQTHLLETLRGMQSVKVANQEPLRRADYENLMVATVNQDVRLARMNLGFGSASQLVFGVERIAVIWLGALLALDSVFSVGMLIAYLSYKDQFATRAGALIDKGIEFRMLRLHAQRLADIMLAEPEDGPLHEEVPAGAWADAPAPASLPPLTALAGAGIEVENLSFRHAQGEPWLLKDCSFRIEPGESVAIVGPSGCGKSTLLKLLLGLLSPTAGSIRIGGHLMQPASAARVRGLTGCVMQDDRLFAGSIGENISFFDPGFQPDRIEQAARLAAIHDEIMAMPMNYHSLVGDMGSALSGGQRQRLMLARALYRQPQFLFLDEATSHLDVACERQVSEAVSRLPVTRVIVAHRPETIASASRVLVMQGGRLQEATRQEAP